MDIGLKFGYFGDWKIAQTIALELAESIRVHAESIRLKEIGFPQWPESIRVQTELIRHLQTCLQNTFRIDSDWESNRFAHPN